MTLTYRMIVIAVAVFGLGLGVAFGAGVAYGRSDPKEVQSGLTAQQIQSLLGVSGGQAASTQSGAGAAESGQQQRGGAAGRIATGLVTGVEGQTLTIETRQGSQRINLAPSTTISKLSSGTAADIKPGLAIVASGSRKDDGSFDATDVTQVSAELQALLAAALGGATGSATPAAGRTP